MTGKCLHCGSTDIPHICAYWPGLSGGIVGNPGIGDARSYAHMCRDGHAEISHNDSSDEACPLCRERARAESASLKLAAADRLAEAYAEHVCACEQPYCGAQPVGVFRCERCGKCCAESLRSALLEYQNTKV